jgi:hypothetical protein
MVMRDQLRWMLLLLLQAAHSTTGLSDAVRSAACNPLRQLLLPTSCHRHWRPYCCCCRGCSCPRSRAQRNALWLLLPGADHPACTCRCLLQLHAWRKPYYQPSLRPLLLLLPLLLHSCP